MSSSLENQKQSDLYTIATSTQLCVPRSCGLLLHSIACGARIREVRLLVDKAKAPGPHHLLDLEEKSPLDPKVSLLGVLVPVTARKSPHLCRICLGEIRARFKATRGRRPSLDGDWDNDGGDPTHLYTKQTFVGAKNGTWSGRDPPTQGHAQGGHLRSC